MHQFFGKITNRCRIMALSCSGCMDIQICYPVETNKVNKARYLMRQDNIHFFYKTIFLKFSTRQIKSYVISSMFIALHFHLTFSSFWS